MVRVTQLNVTCEACPAQLEGLTDEGWHVYARARHGRFYIGIDVDRETAVLGARARFFLSGNLSDDLATCCTSHLRLLVAAFVGMINCGY